MARTSPYESGELTDSIFLILLSTLKPIHGYRIMQEISDMTGGNLSIGPATMYTTLAKLKTAAWISEIEELDMKKIYQITDEGLKVLKKNYTFRNMVMMAAARKLEENSNGKV